MNVHGKTKPCLRCSSSCFVRSVSSESAIFRRREKGILSERRDQVSKRRFVDDYTLVPSHLLTPHNPPPPRPPRPFGCIRIVAHQVSPRFTYTGAVAALHKMRAVPFLKHRHREESDAVNVDLDLRFDCDEVS